MTWSIYWSRDAIVFVTDNHLSEETVTDLIRRSLCKFQGDQTNVDIKKLQGEWSGFYRIRKGKLRIIAEFIFDQKAVRIQVIDWRGSVYR